MTRLLLLPSLFSSAVILLIVASVLGYNAWLYISEKKIFYDYLFGTHGLQTYLWVQSQQASAWSTVFLRSPLAYYVLVSAAATAAGLAVYVLLQWLGLIWRGGGTFLRELRTPGSQHKNLVTEMLGRLGIRVVSLIGWAVYGAFFLSTLLPFTFVLYRLSIDHIHAGGQLWWAGCFIVALLFVLALHMHVVFLRLVFLRPRLFGGDQVIEEAEIETHQQLTA